MEIPPSIEKATAKTVATGNIIPYLIFRFHELSHSHVSLLIDMGFPAMLIAERIGDTVEMINNTYGHLYPNRHEEVADKLEQLVSN